MGFYNSIQTGYALDAVEGVASTLTSAHYVNDAEASAIKIDIAVTNIKSPGRNGTVKQVKGKTTATLPSIKVPVAYNSDLPFMLALGCVSAASNTLILRSPIATGVDSTRTSNRTMSFGQQLVSIATSLTKAKPATFKITGKAGEPIYLEMSFQGTGTTTNTSATGNTFAQTPSATQLNGLISGVITIGGRPIDYSEFEIDYGPSLVQGSDASTATGLTDSEIVAYEPKFTINPKHDLRAFESFQQLTNLAVVPVVVGFGSGTGNTYNFTFDASIDSTEYDKEDELLVNKQVYSVITKANGDIITRVLS